MRAIEGYYEAFDEESRLAEGAGELEFLRTCEILGRYLPAGPSRVLDIGGGPGAYSLFLLTRGHEVHLLDPLERHVSRARERGIPSAVVGDARALPWRSACADFVLFLGPLYHLVLREDRVAALREALRVLRPGGRILAAAISRYASLIDGLLNGVWDDASFAPILEQDLRTGQHRNETGNPAYFTTAFFHRPEEFAGEIAEAGFVHTETFPVEGPGWLARDLPGLLGTPVRRERLLSLVRSVEREPSLLALTAHLVAIGAKPSDAPSRRI